MFALPVLIRTEILRTHGTKCGFVVLTDKFLSNNSLHKLKSAVFWPFDIGLFESDPLEAESTIKKYFEHPNLCLKASIRLRNGCIRPNPNPGVALIGSQIELQQLISSATGPGTSLHLIILPIALHVNDVVDCVLSLGLLDQHTASLPMKVGYNLAEFLDEWGESQKRGVTHVIACVSFYTNSPAASGSTGDIGSYLVVNIPSGKRSLGESSGLAGERVVFEHCGIRHSIQDESYSYFITPDKCNKIFVEEILRLSLRLPSIIRIISRRVDDATPSAQTSTQHKGTPPNNSSKSKVLFITKASLN